MYPSKADPQKKLCEDCMKEEVMEDYAKYLKSKGSDPDKSIVLKQYYKTKNQLKITFN